MRFLWHQNEFSLADGTRLRFRPITANDTPHLLDIFSNLSAQSRYQRFIAPVDSVPEERVAQIASQMVADTVERGKGVLAFVEIDGKETAVGGARYFREAEGERSAEFAITIRDDHQHRGLGKLLLDELIRQAKRNGIRRLTGLALADNVGLWKLVEHTGYPVTRHSQQGEIEFDILIG